MLKYPTNCITRHSRQGPFVLDRSMEYSMIPTGSWKHNGLWYSKGSAHDDFWEGCGASLNPRNLWKLKIKGRYTRSLADAGKNKILLLSDANSCKDFANRYMKETSCNDWSEVMTDFGGIEICKVFESALECGCKDFGWDPKFNFFVTWDYDSGSIWDLSLIRSVKKFVKSKPTTFHSDRLGDQKFHEGYSTVGRPEDHGPNVTILSLLVA